MFCVLLRSGHETPMALKQALDFGIAAAAFGHKAHLVVSDQGIDFFMENGLSVCDNASHIRALLSQLPLFDLAPIWICENSLDQQNRTLDDMHIEHIQVLTSLALNRLIAPPHHTLIF
ncbi:MAG: DsrE family protein [Gammaproteobacteria bacterium]